MTASATNWDLFAAPLFENSTKYMEYKEIRERTNNPGKNERKMIFEIRDRDSWILPSHAFLEVKLEMNFANGDPIPDDLGAAVQTVALENGCQLFSEGSYRIEDKIIERVDDLHKKQLVMNMLEYSEDYSVSVATDHHWFKDTGAGGTDPAKYGSIAHGAAGVTFTTAITAGGQPLSVKDGTKAVVVDVDAGGNQPVLVAVATGGGNFVGADSDTYNDGYVKRARLFTAGKTVVLRVPLSRLFGFCKSIQQVSTGSTHTIELIRNDFDEFVHAKAPFTNTADTPVLKYKDIALWMPYLKPSLAFEVSLEKALSQGGSRSAVFEYATVFKKVGETKPNISWNIVSASEKPSKVILWFQQDAKDAPSKRLINKSIFNNLELTRASLRAGGGSKFPEYDFTSKFDERDYARLYHEMLRVSDKSPMDYNTGTQISHKSFGALFPMICFDLRESDDKLFTAGSSTDLTFKADITRPATTGNYANTYSMYALVISERVLRMDIISRQVRFDVQ